MIDSIIIGIILVAAVLAVIRIVKKKASGQCGCGCSGCSKKDGCS